MSKQAARLRRDKVVAGVKPQTKDKFLEVIREEGLQPLLPKFEAANANQKLALGMLNEGRSIVFLTGCAGTGKSMIAAYRAAKLLKEKKIEKVFLVRPAVATGKSIGLLPGTLEEKLEPYFAQTVTHLKYFMGGAYTQYCLDKGIIEYKAVEYLRGTSFENCLVIFEETQNFSGAEFEMLLTRLGKNSTFIFTGDCKQNDLHGTSGLSETINRLTLVQDQEPTWLSDEELDLMEDQIGIVTFTAQDVVRSGLARVFVKIYNQ